MKVTYKYKIDLYQISHLHMVRGGGSGDIVASGIISTHDADI